jgi:hypothetical protein
MDSLREGILLLSARPEAHAPLMSALSRTGVNVRVARHPDRALEFLHRPPTLAVDGYCRADAQQPVIHAQLGKITTGTPSLP